jgi:hypothetical protein
MNYRIQLAFRTLTICVLTAFGSGVFAWDHPGHMITAAIAFEEIERERPELIEKLGLLFLKHPDPAPFWVAVGEAKGKERVRRMFIECSRWPDDNKFTNNDKLTWHTARYAIVEDDAPPEARALVAARAGKPVGQALESLALSYGMLWNPESSPNERAWALCWLMHVVGDIHQPFHASDLFSKDFPAGNMAGSTGYVRDPVSGVPIPLHILWDSNALRDPSLKAVDRARQTLTKKYPRSHFPELSANPHDDPKVFENWLRESYQVALKWAFRGVKAVPDTTKYRNSDEVVASIVNFILNGVSPVKEAPELPDGYWDRARGTAEQRITLAGYRIADLVLAAAATIETHRNPPEILPDEQQGWR